VNDASEIQFLRKYKEAFSSLVGVSPEENCVFRNKQEMPASALVHGTTKGRSIRAFALARSLQDAARHAVVGQLDAEPS
jgi:hypothetical protein